ncbi:MAG: DUF1080 domain-containing protein [bacterium]|nr:DUF1080 domain-containing protein [bacterium]
MNQCRRRVLAAGAVGLATILCPLFHSWAASEESATVPLFNGRDLSGFYTFIRDRGRGQDPKNVFTVQDGLLHISGEEWGCVTTEEEYENYHLVAEFKWGEKVWAPREDKARDSGVLLHSAGEDGGYGGIWMHSIECQVIEGGTGDIIVVGDGSDRFSVTSPVQKGKPDDSLYYKQDGTLTRRNGGRINWFARDPGWKDELGFRGLRDVEKPVGEWNRLECIANGGDLTIVLNGIIVNQAFDVTPRKGRIQIQSEAAEIVFRRFDVTPLAAAPQSAASAPRKHRFIYNSDGNNMLIYKDYPMKPSDLHSYVDEVADSQVTSFFVSPNFGMPVTYPTEVGDLIGAHASPELATGITPDAAVKSTGLGIMNTRALIEAGSDAIAPVIDRAHEKGLEAFISWRLNEVHAVEQEDSLIFSRFWKEHPEWRIGKAGDPMPAVYHDILGPNVHPIVGSWLPGGLNFAVPEVRAHRLAQLRECCERFDLDGLELDFQRFPMYFKPGEEAQHIATMTAWMREVRSMTKEVGEKRGRPILLCARIMARPEQNRAIGLDPVAWANESLIDFVIVSHYLRNDYPLPIRAYRELLPPDMPIYASIEVAPTTDAFRRLARQLWEDEVDGIYLFNFFTKRERGTGPPNELLDELGRPDTIPAEVR